MVKETPMMSQYLRFKRQYPDAIVLFRVGDFYETFYDDAKIVSKELGIALTARQKKPVLIPMAGVPWHALEDYLSKLVRAGYKVVIVDQLEPPSPKKKLVKRGVTRIVTAGTAVEDTILDAGKPNYLVAIVSGLKGSWGVAAVEVSTGIFLVTAFKGNIDVLIDEVGLFNPSEILLPASLFEDGHLIERIRLEFPSVRITPRDDISFDVEMARSMLKYAYRIETLEGFDIERVPLAVSCAGAIIEYIQEVAPALVNNLKPPRLYFRENYVSLDYTTVRNLELLKNLRDGGKVGTLLWVLDQTQTPMGRRLLREWILHPLLDEELVNKRLDAVEEFVERFILREKLRELISGIADLERLMAKINIGRITPKDLAALRDTLEKLPGIVNELNNAESELLKEISEKAKPVEWITVLLKNAIVDDPPSKLEDGGIIKDGFDETLDELRSILREGHKHLLSIEKREKARTGIQSLKIGYNTIFGYYIEVTKANISRVPPDYTLKQTLVNANRYITPELKRFEEKIITAKEKALKLEQEIFQKIREKICRETRRIQQIGAAIAELDVLLSLAEVAANRQYCRPVVDGSDIIDIKEGRHPVVEAMIDEPFVPNDTYLDSDKNRILIVTGPNMAGKSTYIRQVALITIMARIGSFVPAKSARIGRVDRIFTRVGASDDISRRMSTFMVEMAETANILNNASRQSLVILDEIGRGTSTFDGMSIAWATIEYIAYKIGAKTLFATHYHELTDLEKVIPGVRNYHMDVREIGNKVIFSRKVLPGPSDKSYGIHVARLAGLPEEVIERAEEILEHVQANSSITIPVIPSPQKNSSRFTRKVSPPVDRPSLNRKKSVKLPALKLPSIEDKEQEEKRILPLDAFMR